jgi:hypothetical protein
VTKETLTAFARKQKEDDDAERQNNIRAQRRHTPEQLLAFAMWVMRDGNPKRGTGADFCFRCHACRNRVTHKPRLAVNVYRGTHGAFFCYECKAGGGLKKLATEKVGLFVALSKLAGIERSEPVLFDTATKLLKGYTDSGYQQAS